MPLNQQEIRLIFDIGIPPIPAIVIPTRLGYKTYTAEYTHTMLHTYLTIPADCSLLALPFHSPLTASVNWKENADIFIWASPYKYSCILIAIVLFRREN